MPGSLPAWWATGKQRVCPNCRELHWTPRLSDPGYFLTASRGFLPIWWRQYSRTVGYWRFGDRLQIGSRCSARALPQFSWCRLLKPISFPGSRVFDNSEIVTEPVSLSGWWANGHLVAVLDRLYVSTSHPHAASRGLAGPNSFSFI